MGPGRLGVVRAVRAGGATGEPAQPRLVGAQVVVGPSIPADRHGPAGVDSAPGGGTLAFWETSDTAAGRRRDKGQPGQLGEQCGPQLRVLAISTNHTRVPRPWGRNVDFEMYAVCELWCHRQWARRACHGDEGHSSKTNKLALTLLADM
jgi:hypothetical protein